MIGPREYCETLKICLVYSEVILDPVPTRVPPIIQPAILSYSMVNTLESKKVKDVFPICIELPKIHCMTLGQVISPTKKQNCHRLLGSFTGLSNLIMELNISLTPVTFSYVLILIVEAIAIRMPPTTACSTSTALK